MRKMGFFGLKLGLDLEKWVAHPHQKFQGVPPHPPGKDLNLKKADKGNTLVVMDKNDKIQEGQVQIDDRDNYKPLDKPIVKETHTMVSQLISKLHCGKRDIDDMTRKWLSQTPNPLRIPEFYTLTKIHKPTLEGRPIISISGRSGPTQRLSAFADTLLQPISIS